MEIKTELNLTLDLDDLINIIKEKTTASYPDWQVKKIDFIYKDVSPEESRCPLDRVNGVTIIMEPKVMKKEDPIWFR